MWVAQVDAEGRVCVPREALAALGIEPGTRVRVEIRDEALVLTPEDARAIRPEPTGRVVHEAAPRYQAERREPAPVPRTITLALSDEHWQLLEEEARRAGLSLGELISRRIQSAPVVQPLPHRTVEQRLGAVQKLSRMSLPVSNWEQMEQESTTYDL